MLGAWEVGVGRPWLGIFISVIEAVGSCGSAQVWLAGWLISNESGRDRLEEILPLELGIKEILK